jgi:hypothetical protein
MTISKTNMEADKKTPMIHANFFCWAPTYSGTWLLTINRPMIREGENFGLINTLIEKSIRKIATTYFIILKSLLNIMSISPV